MKIAALAICIAAVSGGVYLFFCEMTSRQAAEIFNAQMAKQKVLVGTITAEKLSADLWGNVYFANLQRNAGSGASLVSVGEGRMKVSPWDIVWNKPSVNSIKELELQNARLHVGFDKDMNLDFMQSRKKSDCKKEPDAQEMSAVMRNFQAPEHLPNIKLILKNTVLSAEYERRLFILNDVNALLQIKNHKELTIHLAASKFGGSMVGDGLNIDGTVQLKEPQNVQINLGLYNVVPSSLGLSNANDPMTLTGEMKGTLQSPTIDGAVSMPDLNLPGLHFTKINGNYHYDNGIITLDDVTGSVYGGTVEAYGLYNFDKRYYNIDAHGKGLMASAAAKSFIINCSVDLDIKFRNRGRGKDLVFGKFSTGKGSCMLVPFQSISGSFSDQNNELAFSDVVIKTDIGSFESNAFRIVKGRVHLSNIFLVEANGAKTQFY